MCAERATCGAFGDADRDRGRPAGETGQDPVGPAAGRARGASDLAPCRTTRRGGWSTTPTPTSWRRPTWLRDHADPAIRDRIQPLRYPGGNELRQTGDPAEQQRDLGAAFERLPGDRTPARPTGRSRPRRSCCGRTSPPPAGSSPRTVPGPSTCSASPASSSSTPSTTGGCATGSTGATRSWPSAPPGPTTGAWSSSARSTLGCWRPATCPWPTSTGRPRWRPRPSSRARPRC